METQFGRAPDSGNFYILSNLFLILGNVKTHVILKLDNRRIMITEPSFKLVFQLMAKCVSNFVRPFQPLNFGSYFFKKKLSDG